MPHFCKNTFSVGEADVVHKIILAGNALSCRSYALLCGAVNALWRAVELCMTQFLLLQRKEIKELIKSPIRRGPSLSRSLFSWAPV